MNIVYPLCVAIVLSNYISSGITASDVIGQHNDGTFNVNEAIFQQEDTEDEPQLPFSDETLNQPLRNIDPDSKLEYDLEKEVDKSSQYKQPATMNEAEYLDESLMQQNDGDGNRDDFNDENVDDDTDAEQQLSKRYRRAYRRPKNIHSLPTTNYRNRFKQVCPGKRHALYYVYSRHSNRKEDRRWRFTCKRITTVNFGYCYWTEFLNYFDKPVLAQCDPDFVMTGVSSYYSVRHRDRKFRIHCCHAFNYKTKSCNLSGFVNNWDRLMHYGVQGQRVFTGFYSYHANSKEDRRWKFADCVYTNN